MNELLLKELNLSHNDYQEIIQRIGREPLLVELGLFSAMWSEHCSYRSSKQFLKRLPIASKDVVQGPGENAGVIRLKDELCLVFKVESHNHPSAVEPFQGAATGVGGIIRDIFTMGARPIAVLDSLSFDSPSQNRARFLLDGVVEGISFYGNCVGVPNAGGETHFESCYGENPLVNVMCAGVLSLDDLQSSAAKTAGAKVIYIGAKTGRDGIHGASFASGVLDEEAKKRKSSVQVGDPFLEKLLIEAVLEITREGLVEAIQDMGAAGLTSSSVEMAGKGKKGIELHLDHIPLREPDITPFEMMLSESQERMLVVAKAENTEKIKAILNKWELEYAEIGHITDTQHIEIFYQGKQVCNLPIDYLLEAPSVDQSPQRDVTLIPEIKALNLPDSSDWTSWLREYCTDPDQGLKNWIFEQYDTTLLTQTIIPPGFGATLLHLKDSDIYLGLTLNSLGSWCAIDPYQGAMAVLSLASRRLSAIGMEPVALTNCLNFGNPQKSHILWEFSQTIEGMKDWLDFFGIPVVSGNVSFYNEGKEKSIFPTPAMGMVGRHCGHFTPPSPCIEKVGLHIAVIGETLNERFDGKKLPSIDLSREKKVQAGLRKLIHQQDLQYAKSIDQGGLIKTLTAAAAQSKAGIKISEPLPMTALDFFFSESHGRFLIAFEEEKLNSIQNILEDIPLQILGKTIPDLHLILPHAHIALDELKHTMETGFSKWMNAFHSKTKKETL